jgi:tRNA-specific 2-thiouridylase
MSRERVIVGMSGGVDSAVAAVRLLQAGFEVHGLHMTNWDEADEYCTAADDYQAARRACADLGIPLHRVSFAAEYREQVFADFLAGLRAGRTPNPDVLCNRHIKFGHFLAYANRLGASRIATGHYARLDSAAGRCRLLRAADTDKDQTYFLHAVAADALARALFPIGDLTKSEVRRLANDAGLPNHDRPDSTGICFIGERPFRDFLSRYLPHQRGPLLTGEGTEIGQHDGLAFYTIGQRSGIGIGGRAGSGGEAWYVAAKDPDRNALVVVQGRDHPRLWSDAIEAGAPRWINGPPPELASGVAVRLEARIRHRHALAGCAVTRLPDESLRVSFDERQWAVAPGQYVVFYDGPECLGGAVIERPIRYNRAPPGPERPAANSRS